MVTYKTFNDIVVSFLEYLRLVQPDLDTKPGTVSRDVFVDAPADQIANLYSQLRTIAGLQSLFSSNGADLSKWASNFGVGRVSGSVATGVAVLTTNTLDTDNLIPQNTVLTANNGVTFKTTENIVMDADNASVYRANATRLRSELDLASITDTFAVEVNTEALVSGVAGNIGKYMLTSQNISGISNVTNLSTFTGGSDAESDDDFRTRILSIFSGSNTGTTLGYTTALSVVPGIQDSVVVVPGDPLMVRDGTQVTTDSSGNSIVSNPGTGGKVDIYTLGSKLSSQIDSFIYNDQSGKQNPTDTSNDYILGQRGEDYTLNVSQRRVELVESDTLPYQPAYNISSVAGSVSGENFVQQYTDSQGRVKGNYTLVKDTGDYGGSSFGFDKLRWTSSTIELEDESVIKGVFNGVDSLEFSDVNKIANVTQDIFVVNENSTVNSTNRSSVTLSHTPIETVSRVANLTTGERYVISDQNPDGTSGELNTTGKITISGGTLPAATDVLQVDYTWKKPFDNVFDLDNLYDYNFARYAQDSVDWGFGNLVKYEPATVSEDAYGTLTVTVSHPIYRVISVVSLESETVTASSGTVTASKVVNTVVDMRRVSDNAEMFNTDERDGSILGTASVVLPTDSLAQDDDSILMRFNQSDLYNLDGYDEGTFESNVITLADGVAVDGASVFVTYVANVHTLIPEQELSILPISGSVNKFLINYVSTGEQPTSNLYDSNDVITNNLRRAPSNIHVEVDSIGSAGIISLVGYSIKKVTDALVSVTAGSGYEVDLQSAIKSDLGVTSLPSTVKVIKVTSVERVNINSSGSVSSVDNTYNIVNYKLKDNTYDIDIALPNSSLSISEFELPQTTDNVSSILVTGNVVRVTFYYMNTSDSEQLYFSENGSHYTDKKFSYISKMSISSGFKNSLGVLDGTIIVKNSSQPLNNTSYDTDYNYTAPKENERITVTYNYNSLVNTSLKAIEDVRPITADVLVKQAIEKSIDVQIKIVLLPEYEAQETTVLQDSVDAVTAFLTASSLGTTVDNSDLVDVLYSVNGIDRVRVINFSTESSGNVLSITAKKNEYLNAGTISIEAEER